MEFSQEILIDGAPADIAGIMFDPARETEWMTSVTASVAQSRGITPGAEVRRTSRVAAPDGTAHDVSWSTCVDAFHFPHILRLTIGGGATGAIKYEVQRHGGGSVARVKAVSERDLFGFDLHKLKALVEQSLANH